MRLVNTDGMAFFGTGSEWFWTALSGIILAVTFLAIYRQLRLQASASAIGQLEAFKRDWESERQLRCRLEILVALHDGRKPSEIPEGAAARLSNYWEQVGALVRGGHLDRRLSWNYQSNLCQTWWAWLEPWVRSIRAEVGDPSISENFEWLAAVMREMDERAGRTVSYRHDQAWMIASRERSIVALQEAIGLEEALRTVVLSRGAMAIAQPLAAPVVADS